MECEKRDEDSRIFICDTLWKKCKGVLSCSGRNANHETVIFGRIVNSVGVPFQLLLSSVDLICCATILRVKPAVVLKKTQGNIMFSRCSSLNRCLQVVRE